MRGIYFKLWIRQVPLLLIMLIVMLALCGRLYYSYEDKFEFLFGAKDIHTFYGGWLSDGDILYGKINEIPTSYADTERGRCYIIPIANGYMGLYLRSKYNRRTARIISDTVAYYNGESDTLSSHSIRTRGIVQYMVPEEQEMFYRKLRDAGFTEDMIEEQAYPYTYRVASFWDWNSVLDLFLFWIRGIIYILLILWFLVYLLTDLSVRPIKRTIRRRGLDKELIFEDLEFSNKTKNIWTGYTYLLAHSVFSWYLYEYKDILWVYAEKKVRKKRKYGIPTGEDVTYMMYYTFRNGSQEIMDAKNQEEIDLFMKNIQQRHPHIILGYSDQIAELYKNKNMEELIRISEYRRDHPDEGRDLLRKFRI